MAKSVAATAVASGALQKQNGSRIPFTLFIRRAGAASFVVLIAAIIWKWRKRLQEAVGAVQTGLSNGSSSRVLDPIYGKEMGLVYKMDSGTELWEEMLDGFRFPVESPIRRHVRQLFGRPELHEQLSNLFDALSKGSPRLTQADVRRFSSGINGYMHVLLQKSTQVPLVSATPQDMAWIADQFDVIFPDERPLDKQQFPSFAKFILLRRVVRTLIDSVGLEGLQAGVAVPLVIDVKVDSGGDTPPFRVHTVTPSSAPGIDKEESFLGLIKEERGRFGSVESADSGDCSPIAHTKK